VQQLAFGFICPDHEFKSRLTMFMYTQNMSTFEFTEELNSLSQFLKSGDWSHPIALKSEAQVNPVNLITSLANEQGRQLIVLRNDPNVQATKLETRMFNNRVAE
jgi:hypothetical protein